MAHILYRASIAPTVPSSTSAKGSGLTNLEIDGNWRSLNDGKLEVSAASSTNDINKVVQRDGSGNFAAGTITAALSGNATTATTLQFSRTINGTAFNGSTNITITANTPNTLTIGTYLLGSDFNGASATTWAVDATPLNTASKIVARDANGDFTARIISATDFNSTSDRKFKENIESINSPLDILNNIQGVSFNWKANQKESFGIIAQDLQEVLPQLVSENEVGLTVSYIPLISILIEAIKQQQKQIDELKSLLA